MSLMDAFRSADEVLLNGVQGITDLITTPGLINLDQQRIPITIISNGSNFLQMPAGRAFIP